MKNRKLHRNHQIIHLREQGATLANLADQFGISKGRIGSILQIDGALESLKNGLRAVYGNNPSLDTLPDETPIDVLLLHDTNEVLSRSLLRRLRSYDPPIRDLGDLRRTSKRRLLAVPGIGPRTLAVLKSLCSARRRSKRRKLT